MNKKQRMRRHFLSLIYAWAALAVPSAALAQSTVTVKGKVYSKKEVDRTDHDHASSAAREEEGWEPLPGAYVVWKGTGQGTATDVHGFFKLQGQEGDTLVASFIGLKTAELPFVGQDFVEIPLGEGFQLNEAVVESEGPSTSVSLLDPLVVQSLGRDELCRAACCNLSEAFETNAAVDASFTDAVTGTKQIRMLGLDGKYTQIMFDNMPGARGLNILQGMKFIPGEWVDKIHIGKGAGSATLGHESMTGQINVALRNADGPEKLIVNGFTNRSGRYELNTVSRHVLSRKWKAGLLTHGEWSDRINDRNADGFQDNALSKDLVIRTNLKYAGDRGVRGDYAVTVISQEKSAGQLPLFDQGRDGLWFADQFVDRVVASAKTGYIFPGDESRSIGSQVSVGMHDQALFFGPNRGYVADQFFARVNVLYQSPTARGDDLIWGINAKVDRYGETLQRLPAFAAPDSMQTVGTERVERNERTTGAFMEWNVKRERWDMVLGLRSDIHDTFGVFVSPRLNARWSLTDATTLKLAAGRGWRTSVPFAEFAGVWASNRAWAFSGADEANGFRGLDPEESWNVGLNWLSKFSLGYRDASFSLDGYRVTFANRVFVDLDTPGLALVRQGYSQSKSVQAEFWWDWSKRVDLTVAYRFVDAVSDYGDFSGYRQDPFVAQHRGFVTVAYGSKPDDKGRQWRADVTFQATGPQRLPRTQSNPIEYQRPDYAPTFVTGNLQISRDFAEGKQIYAGVENVTDYRQADPIIGVDHLGPGGLTPATNARFDASLVYAPIFGRNMYLGVRWAFDR